MWDNVTNWFKNIWASVNDFCSKSFNHLVDTFGKPIATVQACLIGALAIFLLVFLIICIINPKKMRQKKLNKAHKKQEILEKLHLAIYTKQEAISTVESRIATTKKNAEYEIFNLTQEEKYLTEQDNIKIDKNTSRITVLSDRIDLLEQVLLKDQMALFRAKSKTFTLKDLINFLRKEQVSCTNDIGKRLIDIKFRKEDLQVKIETIIEDTDELCELLEAKKAELEQELEQLVKNLEHYEKKRKNKLTKQEARLLAREYARIKKSKKKMAIDNAMEELKKAKAKYELACKKRLEMEKLKNNAVENIKNARKELVESKAFWEDLDYGAVVKASAVRTEEHDHVNIYIADVDKDGAFILTPEIEENQVPEISPFEEITYEEPSVEIFNFSHLTEEEVNFIEAILDDIDFVSEDSEKTTAKEEPTPSTALVETAVATVEESTPIETVIEETTATAVEEPTPSVTVIEETTTTTEEESIPAETTATTVDEKATPEIIEKAFETNDEITETTEEPIVEEITATIEEPIIEEITETIEEPIIEEITETIEEPIVEEVNEVVENPTVEEVVETVAEPEIEEVAEEPTTEETPEIIEDNQPIQAPAKKKPQGKIYNDGIPAVPINKKSKYQKPRTKIITKKKQQPETKEENEVQVSQPQAVEEKEQASVKSAYSGKWQIVEENGRYYAKLLASNGGLMLTTPDYASVSGLKSAIATIKKNLLESNTTIGISKNGKFIFKVFSSGNRIILVSEEYNARYQCEKALESAKRFSETATIGE